MTSYVFMWEDPDGKRKWEAVKEAQIEGFLSKLVEDEGVHPATVMVAHAPIFFHWVWRKYHRGLSGVNFRKINEEIYGTEPSETSNHKPVDVPLAPKKPVKNFGWLSPDGRFFGCDYGGHSSLASRIVGNIQHVANPERHLEDLGWAKILSGSIYEKKYAIGMDPKRKLTDAQLKTLQSLHLETAFGIEDLL